MKKLLSILLAFALVIGVVGLIGCAKEKEVAIFKPGTYTGEGQGHGGTMALEVTVTETAITSIELIKSNESKFSDDAINAIIEDVINSNTGDVDTVTGASETSNGILTSINNALKKAYVNGESSEPRETNAVSNEGNKEDVTVDIVVVGAGGAGMSAGAQAAKDGASVLILEKMAIVGGNTNYATGGMNAAETVSQQALGIEDSVQAMIEDTMVGGKKVNNIDLVTVLAEKSSQSVDWLIELGADLSDVGKMGGASEKRAHRPTGGAPVGNHIASVLRDACDEAGVEIRTESKVTGILANDGVVEGVVVTTEDGTYNVYAKAVIIATGGFGADNKLVASFASDLEGFGTTNHPGATGDALNFVDDLNISLVDINSIQTHPTVVPEANKMITEAVRGNGAILVNRNAQRFIDELQTRDVVSAAELEQEGGTAFLVFDQGVRESLSAIEKYYNAGLLTEAATLEELAEALGIDGKSLVNTVTTYNGYVVEGSDPEYGRTSLDTTLEKGPFYAVEVGPAVHHTMGGYEINANTEVIDTQGNVIPGLYAAGEVTGGVHGANRLGGNALSDIVTFGRIAGSVAAEYSAE